MTLDDSLSSLSLRQPSTPGPDPHRLWHEVSATSLRPRYRNGPPRSATPTETLHRIRPLLPWAGISRLGDLTGMDRLGIPVYQAIRPHSRNYTVALGHGATRTQAKVSALMEALECFHSEALPYPSWPATLGEVRPALRYDPSRLLPITAGGPAPPPETLSLEWVPATDLCTGDLTRLPRQVCELDLAAADRRYARLVPPDPDGLASGNTYIEAVTHGLCEVIERDSRSRAAAGTGVRQVPIESIHPRPCRDVIGLMRRVGLAVRVEDLTGPTGVPCLRVTLTGPDGRRVTGAGCHPHRTTCLLHALTEAAQCRLAVHAGVTDHAGSDQHLAPGAGPVPEELEFDQVPTVNVPGWVDTVREIAARIHAATGAPPLAVDLTRAGIHLPVVRVVAPGLWSRPAGSIRPEQP